MRTIATHILIAFALAGVIVGPLAMAADCPRANIPAVTCANDHKLLQSQQRDTTVVFPNATKVLKADGTVTVSTTDIGSTGTGAGIIPVTGTDGKVNVSVVPDLSGTYAPIGSITGLTGYFPIWASSTVLTPSALRDNGGLSYSRVGASYMALHSYWSAASPSGLILRHSDATTLDTKSTTANGSMLGQILVYGVSSATTPDWGNASALRWTQSGSAGTSYVPAKFELLLSDGAAVAAPVLTAYPDKSVAIAGAVSASNITATPTASAIVQAKTDHKVDVGWLPVGTTAGTVAAGDDSRITGAVAGSGTISGTANYLPKKTAGGWGDSMIQDEGGSAVLLKNPTMNAAFRMLPFYDDVYFQNTVSTGNIYFSGGYGAQLTGSVIFNTSGNVYFGSSNSWITAAGALTGRQLALNGATSGTVTISPPATVTSYTMTPPAAAATAAGQVWASTGANATMQWVTPATGSSPRTVYYITGSSLLRTAGNVTGGTLGRSVSTTPSNLTFSTAADAPFIDPWLAGAYTVQVYANTISSSANMYAVIKDGTTVIATTQTVTVASGSPTAYNLTATTATDAYLGVTSGQLIVEIWAVVSAGTASLVVSYGGSTPSYVSTPWAGFSSSVGLVASASGNSGSSRTPAMKDHQHQSELAVCAAGQVLTQLSSGLVTCVTNGSGTGVGCSGTCSASNWAVFTDGTHVTNASYTPVNPTRTVCGHALSSDVTCTASDVGAAPSSEYRIKYVYTANLTSDYSVAAGSGFTSVVSVNVNMALGNLYITGSVSGMGSNSGNDCTLVVNIGGSHTGVSGGAARARLPSASGPFTASLTAYADASSGTQAVAIYMASASIGTCQVNAASDPYQSATLIVYQRANN